MWVFFQSLVYYIAAGICQQLHFVAEVLVCLDYKVKVYRQHIGYEYRVVFLHILGKGSALYAVGILLLLFWLFAHYAYTSFPFFAASFSSSAAASERRRILAAPRLVISSIFS